MFFLVQEGAPIIGLHLNLS